MADIERPSQTRRDEFETRRDAGLTRRADPDLTRREGAEHAPSLVRLPAELADRLTVLGELPAQGAESDLLRVRDATGAELIVKIFRRGFTADRSVWRTLPTLDSPHVVRVLETGHAEGRDYEVMEYVPAGNLRGLGAPLPPALVAEVVAQLASGLALLHDAGIVHRDLKPENVLVRSTAPLRLAITDFGLSRVIEQSVVFASSSRTLAYAAPESLSGQVSPARDWWSLGMMVRELLTGRAPFAGMSETAVVDHLATRTVDCDDIADPRMRLLARGLLVRDPRRRWGAAEAEEWLAGESPDVAEAQPSPVSPAAGGTRGALAFGGRSYTDRAELAHALVAEWESAARYFFGAMFTPVGPSEAWQGLRDWLHALDTDDGADTAARTESRIRLIDDRLAAGYPPDVKLLWLVRWLDPAMAPHFLGLRLLPEDLPTLAAIVDDPEHPDHATAVRAARGLWEHRLLPVLAGFADAGPLTAIDEHWRGLVTSWNRHAGWLRSQLPRTAGRLPDAGAPGRDEPPVMLATLLALAARPEEARTALAAAADQARASVRGPVPWFTWLTDNAGDDPLRLIAVVRAAPDAVLEVEGAARSRYEAEQRAAEGNRRWAEREHRRLDARGAAVRRAALWTAPLAVLWFGGSWLFPQIVKSSAVRSLTGNAGTAVDPTPLLVTVAALVWLTGMACETLLAYRQGADYLVMGPWASLAKISRGAGRGLSGASRSVSGAARRAGPRGCAVQLFLAIVPLLVLLILVGTLLSIAWLLWLAVLVVVALGHVALTGTRLQRWRHEQERAKAELMGEAS